MSYSRSELFIFYSASVLAAFIATVAVPAEEPQTLYVQAAQVELKAEPHQGAKGTGSLKRGETLVVTETKDHWVKGTAGKVTGWTSKVFLSAHKPVGQAELVKEVPTTVEKASRRRPQSYTVNAAARGLTEDEAVREGAAGYKTDYKALKRVEGRRVDPAELNKFKDNAKLPQ